MYIVRTRPSRTMFSVWGGKRLYSLSSMSPWSFGLGIPMQCFGPKGQGRFWLRCHCRTPQSTLRKLHSYNKYSRSNDKADPDFESHCKPSVLFVFIYFSSRAGPLGFKGSEEGRRGLKKNSKNAFPDRSPLLKYLGSLSQFVFYYYLLQLFRF